MKKRVFAVITVIFILIIAYWYGGSSENSHGWLIRDENMPAPEQYVSGAGSGVQSVNNDMDSDSYNDPETDVQSDDDIDKQTDDKNKEKTKKDNKRNDERNNNKNGKINKPGKTNKNDKNKRYDKKDNAVTSDINSENHNTEVTSPAVQINPAVQTNEPLKITEKPMVMATSKPQADGTKKPPVKATAKPQSGVATKAPGNSQIPNGDYCTISISCADIVKHMDMLVKGKEELIPSDGVILAETKVSVKAGDTVFDILKRAANDNSIHLEYSYTPVYENYYIEGIANLYEFDCGDLSGWLYNVNGENMSVGMSQCDVSDGDIIKIWYTCDYTS